MRKVICNKHRNPLDIRYFSELQTVSLMLEHKSHSILKDQIECDKIYSYKPKDPKEHYDFFQKPENKDLIEKKHSTEIDKIMDNLKTDIYLSREFLATLEEKQNIKLENFYLTCRQIIGFEINIFESKGPKEMWSTPNYPNIAIYSALCIALEKGGFKDFIYTNKNHFMHIFEKNTSKKDSIGIFGNLEIKKDPIFITNNASFQSLGKVYLNNKDLSKTYYEAHYYEAHKDNISEDIHKLIEFNKLTNKSDEALTEFNKKIESNPPESENWVDMGASLTNYHRQKNASDLSLLFYEAPVDGYVVMGDEHDAFSKKIPHIGRNNSSTIRQALKSQSNPWKKLLIFEIALLLIFAIAAYILK